jgi:hypothetical protein
MNNELIYLILDSTLIGAAAMIGWSATYQMLALNPRHRLTFAVVSVIIGYGIAIGGWQVLLIVSAILLLLSYCTGGRVDSERL